MVNKEYNHVYLGESQGKYSHEDQDTKRDCLEIKRMLSERGITISTEHVHHAWAKMSHDDYCAGWLIVDNAPEYYFEKLMKYLTPRILPEN